MNGHFGVDCEDMFMDGHFLPGFQTRSNETVMIQNFKYKHTYLEGTLTTWPFSKVTIVGSMIGPMTSPAM